MVIGPTPPGTGVMAPATSDGFVKGDIADEPALAVVCRQAIDAHVDHRRARLDPVSAHHLGPADSGNHDIGATDDFGQVASFRMSDGYRGALGRAAAAPSVCRRCSSGRSRPRPGRRLPEFMLQEIEAAVGRARHECGQPRRQAARVDRMKAVDVLRRIDGRRSPVSASVAGNGSWTRIPSTRSSALRSLDELRAGPLRKSCRAGCGRSSPFPLRQWPCSWNGHRLRSRDLRRRARWQGPAGGRSAARTRRRATPQPRGSLAAAAFPSISRAVMRRSNIASRRHRAASG